MPPIPSAEAEAEAARRPRLDPAIRSDLRAVLELRDHLDPAIRSGLVLGLRARRPEARPSAPAALEHPIRLEARPSVLTVQDLRDHQAPLALALELRDHQAPSDLALELQDHQAPSALALEHLEHQAPSDLALEHLGHLIRLEVRLLEAVALDLAIQVVSVLVASEAVLVALDLVVLVVLVLVALEEAQADR